MGLPWTACKGPGFRNTTVGQIVWKGLRTHVVYVRGRGAEAKARPVLFSDLIRPNWILLQTSSNATQVCDNAGLT